MSEPKQKTNKKCTGFNFLANFPYNYQSPGDLRGGLWLTKNNNKYINKFLNNISKIRVNKELIIQYVLPQRRSVDN